MTTNEINARDAYINFLTLAWIEAQRRHGPFPRGSELNVEPLPLDIWLEAVESGPKTGDMEAPPAFVMLSRYDESLLTMIKRTMDILQRIETAILNP